METIFTTETPATADDAGGGTNRVLGIVFKASVAGTIDAIRWYASAVAPSGTVSAHLFSMTNPNDTSGTLLGTNNFGIITPAQWNRTIIGTSILPGVPYCAQIFSPDHYCYTGPGQFASDFTNTVGHLTAYAASSSNNGRFKNVASPTDFPNNSSGGGFNFFVDVEFTQTIVAPPPPSAPAGAPISGWYGLLSIIEEAKEMKREIEERAPMACPNDGQPLLQGPRGTLYCPFDGWHWPEDWSSRDPGQNT